MHKLALYFLLLPDILLLDLAGAADAFMFANRYQEQLRFEPHFISPEPQVQSSIGVQLAQLHALPDQIEDNAIIILCGRVGMCLEYASPPVHAALAWLKQLPATQRMLCICSGALLAAHAGRLRGKAATTHHDHCAELASVDSSIRVLENRIFVEDGAISTSAGVTAGIDLALHHIARLCSQQTALAVARNMVVYLRRSGHDAQLSPWLMYRNHLHPVVHKVQDALQQDPAHDWDLEKIARLACTSTRHLSRLFRSQTGASVQDYLHSLRMHLAEQLLQHSPHSIDKIAELVGYGCARQFRRQWQTAYGNSPQNFRKTRHSQAEH